MTVPAPFVFTPNDERIECSAFSATFKMLAVVVVTLAIGWAWQMWSNGLLLLSWASSGWLGAALCMMLVTEWYILRGTTKLNKDAIEQSWVWNKRVAMQDLAYAKLIRIRGLEWLLAPRLYTKTFSNKLTVFYAAGPHMLVEFQRLETALQAAKQQ
ncbi:MAG: hypothetical protein KGN32_03815 [Burkholderiales bacterium]|nr:hypothetical protein [Burkholderiales bacterium]